MNATAARMASEPFMVTRRSAMPTERLGSHPRAAGYSGGTTTGPASSRIVLPSAAIV